jgi:polar amino acid transport system substrate-binding protein
MRQGKLFLPAALALAAAVGWPGTGGAAEQAAPFRVCADPDNLPFSSSAGDKPGLYIELGQAIAHTLGRDFQPVWSVSTFGKRTVRTTLLAGQCDAYIGLPDEKDFMGPRLIFSKPFLHVGYALVVPPSEPVGSLAKLEGKRVAVQFSTPPHILLASRDGMHTVTFLSPDEALHALPQHAADIAFVWGPSAGYANTTYLHGAYKVVPIAGDGMQWPVAIGFAKENAALRDEVNKALDANAATISALAEKYGFPSAAPVTLASTAVLVSDVQRVADTTTSTETQAAPAPATPAAPAAPAPAASDSNAAPATPAAAAPGDPAAITAGRDIFNGTCAHCHGPDAVQSEKRINLRLLHHRYGDQMDEVFHYTVTHGRPDKGMPNWTGVFSEDDFSKILAFLHSVQTPD